jgi:arginine decarboxylase
MKSCLPWISEWQRSSAAPRTADIRAAIPRCDDLEEILQAPASNRLTSFPRQVSVPKGLRVCADGVSEPLVLSWSGTRALPVNPDLGTRVKECEMSLKVGNDRVRIDRFFAGPGARADQWSHLVELAQSWSRGSANRATVEVALNEMATAEEFHAYPGLKLISALRDAVAANDAHATATLARRITRALLTRSFRQNAGDWDSHEDGEATRDVTLHPALTRTDSHRPYFEILIVTSAPSSHWSDLAEQWRRLRRPLDAFIYEPVFVGTFEDAFCASILNTDLAAVVIHEGFAFRSRQDAPILRSLAEAVNKNEGDDVTALRLAEVLKRVRPELDLYLLSNGQVEEIAGSLNATAVRRLFYAVEELLELHLAILEGVQERYDTPFFNNLKKYAQRPIGTFHALPIARGKSILKSDWIRDMGEFYGPTLFLAESSATTGGLDSLLEPTGNIKKAQELAARAFGADHVFFVTNGTST